MNNSIKKNNLIRSFVKEKIAVKVENPYQEREFRSLCKKKDIKCFLRDFKNEELKTKTTAFPIYFIFDIHEVVGFVAHICYSEESLYKNAYEIELLKKFKKCIKLEEENIL